MTKAVLLDWSRQQLQELLPAWAIDNTDPDRSRAVDRWTEGAGPEY